MGAWDVPSRVMAVAVCALLASLMLSASAGAKTVVVDSIADAGTGSLREAISAANETAQPDRIELSADLGETIALKSALPVVTAPLEIVGPGAGELALTATGDSNLLDLQLESGGEVSVAGLTLRGGVAADGGAIASFDTKLVLSHVELVENRATNAGGALSVTGGSLTLLDSKLEGNSASYPGGAVQLYEAAMRISDSTITNNSAGSSGGGVYVADPSARLLIEGSTVSGNRAEGDGGGVAVSGSPYRSLTVTDSEISGNRAAGDGPDLFPARDKSGAKSKDPGPAASMPPASAGTNGTTDGPSAAANPNSMISAPLEALDTDSGSTALLLNGIALAPPNAPPAVEAAIDAANMISHTPYVWGGGHASWYSAGYDCSGAVSFALHGGGLLDAPLASGQLATWGAPGPGRWITVYASPGHTYAVIAGLRWDTVGDANGSGPRWHIDGPYPAGFAVRHPPGF